MLSVYHGVSHLTSGREVDLLAGVDQAIPFIPSVIWVYLSYILVLASLIFVVDGQRAFGWTAISIIAAVLVSACFYLVAPSSYPRPPVECVDASTCIIKWMYGIDPSNNTFPSLHVGLSFIVAFSLYEHWSKFVGRILVVWALAVSVSTLLVKQHYLIDVFAGFTVAAVVYWAVREIRILMESKRIVWYK